MVAETRERRLVDTFVTLADTLVAGYDVVDLLQTLVEACAELLDASAAGLLLADDSGTQQACRNDAASFRARTVC
jgi:uncharacterized protein YigA (DUF484 family)